MLCLSMDTTGPYCSAALVTHEHILGYSAHKIGRGHAEYLGPQIQTLLGGANLAPAQIDKIAVCTGPGSFTGLRVGIAMAKGLALPRRTPIIGMSALQIWAASQDPARTHTVMAIADVRRSEYFWQIFERGIPLAPPRLSRLEQAQSAFKANMKLAGTGANALKSSVLKLSDLKSNNLPDMSSQNEQDLQSTAHQTGGFVDPAILAWSALHANPSRYPPLPLYHRPADAKLPGGITPPATPSPNP